MIRLTVDMAPPRSPSYTVKEARTGRVLGSVGAAPGGRWQLYVPDGDGEAPWSTPQDDPGWCALRATMRGGPMFEAMWEGGGIEIVADQAVAVEGTTYALIVSTPTRTIPSHELRQNLRDVLDFVQSGGRVVVTRNGREVALMGPPSAGMPADGIAWGLGEGWTDQGDGPTADSLTLVLPSGYAEIVKASAGWWAGVAPAGHGLRTGPDKSTPREALDALLALGRAAMPSEAHRAVFDELAAKCSTKTAVRA